MKNVALFSIIWIRNIYFFYDTVALKAYATDSFKKWPLTPRSIILRGAYLEYLRIFFTHYSVAKADLN